MSASDEPPLGSTLAGKTVVLVEDEGMVQMQLRRLLPLYGAQVVGAARSGAEAVALVRTLRPNLVLMDINMPGEFDGLEAARRILELYSTCIIMLTGYSDVELQQQAQEIGVCAFLTKPVAASSLLPQIEAALRDFSLSKCG